GDLKQFLLATRGSSSKDGNTSRNTGKSPPRPPQLSVTQIIQLASQVAQGMEHLSNQRFVHRDVAARNCLIASNLTVKVSLCALTKDTYNKEYCKYHNQVIPLRWMPYEAVYEDDFSTKSDIYSFACLVWEMFYQGELPFSKMSDDAVLAALKKHELQWKPHKAAPQSLQNLLVSCWSDSPRDRPTFSQLTVTIVLVLSNLAERQQLNLNLTGPRRDIEQYGESVLETMNDKISSEFPQIGICLCDINLTFKKNVNLKTYEGPKEWNNRTVSKSVSYNNMPNITETISMPQLIEKQDDYNISQDDITIQRLLDDENPNCQQVRRKRRKYNEISKPPENIPSINVYNPYDTLMDDTENADNINSSQSTKPLPHKPPPIFIPGVVNVPELKNCVKQKLSDLDFSLSLLQHNLTYTLATATHGHIYI
ncbi:hypothetical protein L9F63_007994, partial [Diploptera punctata]